jgi:putative SOS response-associated peptidase YedK
MPVILPPAKRKTWLDSATDKYELLSLLLPYDAGQMDAYPISTRVGSP